MVSGIQLKVSLARRQPVVEPVNETTTSSTTWSTIGKYIFCIVPAIPKFYLIVSTEKVWNNVGVFNEIKSVHPQKMTTPEIYFVREVSLILLLFEDIKKSLLGISINNFLKLSFIFILHYLECFFILFLILILKFSNICNLSRCLWKIIS